MNRGINSPEEMVRLAMAQRYHNLIRAIELLKECSESLNQEAEGKSMEELRQSQQALAESARRLREMMNQKSDIVPGLQGEPMKSLDQAQNSMGRAENSLGKVTLVTLKQSKQMRSPNLGAHERPKASISTTKSATTGWPKWTERASKIQQ